MSLLFCSCLNKWGSNKGKICACCSAESRPPIARRCQARRRLRTWAAHVHALHLYNMEMSTTRQRLQVWWMWWLVTMSPHASFSRHPSRVGLGKAHSPFAHLPNSSQNKFHLPFYTELANTHLAIRTKEACLHGLITLYYFCIVMCKISLCFYLTDCSSS